MTRSNLEVSIDIDRQDGSGLFFNDGELTAHGARYDSSTFFLNYVDALNLASKLLQWATNLPESEKGNIHKIDGEWVDIDGHSTD